jgi:hypothetical protein
MKRILIIDDDPSIRLLYQEELLEEGYDLYKKEVRSWPSLESTGKSIFQK